MTPRWVVPLLLLSILTGCATTHRVNLETESGEVITFSPSTADTAPVELEEDEFRATLSERSRSMRPSINPQEAARRLFDVDARSGAYLLHPRSHRLTALGPGTHLEGEQPAAEVELTHAYLRWCERTQRPGDCLHLLVDSRTVTGDGRYALAMALTRGAVLGEMLEAFKDMADPQAMVAAVLWTMTTYCILISVPEPFSKGLAAVMTATLIVYLGVDTFWGLIIGFRRLVEEADRATTFEELREAGEQYGKVMGRNAARAFAMLATVAIGNTAAGFAATVPKLPGSAQASAQAGARAGIQLAAVGEVQAVTVTGGAITMALAPGAVAMAAHGMGGAPGPVDAKGPGHHIATDKWWDATDKGGPWSPKFQAIFDKAGMSLNDPANIVKVEGHQGPHPEEYHREIYRRLYQATEECSSMQQCRQALAEELRRLARQISTTGTRLNKLVTRSQ